MKIAEQILLYLKKGALKVDWHDLVFYLGTACLFVFVAILGFLAGYML